MKLTPRDQKLLRWFYDILAVVGIGAVIGGALLAYLDTRSIAAIAALVAGVCLLVVFVAELLNRKRAQRPS